MKARIVFRLYLLRVENFGKQQSLRPSSGKYLCSEMKLAQKTAKYTQINIFIFQPTSRITGWSSARKAFE